MGLILWGGCKRRTDFRYFITGFSLFLPGIFLPLDHRVFTRSSSKVYGLLWQFIRSSQRYHLPAGKGKIFWIASTDKAHLGFGKGTRRIGQPWDKRLHKLLFRDRAVKPA